MRRVPALLALAAMALAGCTVGPNYTPPKDPPPERFVEPAAQGQGVDLSGWWKGYQDPELDRLIAIALQESPDIKTAAARIAEARAQVRAARAGLFPTVDATGGVSYERFSKNGGFGSLASSLGGGGSTGGSGGSGGSSGSSGGVAAPGNSIKTFSVGFDASWEIDLFGGVRRQIEGANAREQSAVWNARDAELSLIAEICDAYLQFRTAQARETIARAEIDRQDRALKILQETYQNGLVPQQDFIRQRTDKATAVAALGPIIADGKAQAHALAALLGRTPEAMMDELDVPRPVLAQPQAVPPGLPSELLRRRPDIRAAERDLAAATADIGVAVADLYPKLSLTAMPQLLSTGLGNLFTGDSFQLSTAANATFPLLDFGRRKATVARRKAQAEEAYQSYRKTVLGAFRDVEDALIRIKTEQDRNQALRSGLADATRSAAAVDARYRNGLVDYSSVLDARRTVLSDQDSLAQSDGSLRRNLISLYKALGGGWSDNGSSLR